MANPWTPKKVVVPPSYSLKKLQVTNPSHSLDKMEVASPSHSKVEVASPFFLLTNCW